MLQCTVPILVAIVLPVYSSISIDVGHGVSMKSAKSFVIDWLHPLSMSKREESVSPIGCVRSSLVTLGAGSA
jgi:hypothetical protein